MLKTATGLKDAGAILSKAKPLAASLETLQSVWNPEHGQASDDKPLAPAQYLLLSVKNPVTRLVCGEWVKEPLKAGLESPIGVPGFTFDTAENFFVNAKKNSVFQIDGNATFYSKGTLTQFSKKLDITTRQRASLSSGQSLTIAAGATADYYPAPGAAPHLVAPLFDRGEVDNLLLDHVAAKNDFLGTAIEETNKVRKELGLPETSGPTRDWGKIREEVRKFSKRVRKLQLATAALQKIATASATAADALDQFVQGDPERSSKMAESARTTPPKIRGWVDNVTAGGDVVTVAGEAVEASSKAWDAWMKKDAKATESPATPAPNSKIDTGLAVISAISLGADQVGREMDRAASRLDQIKKAHEELKKASDEAEEDRWTSLTVYSKAINVAATWCRQTDAFLKDAANALDEQVAHHTLGASKPNMYVAAKEALQVSSGKEMSLYAQEGFRLETSQGEFLLHTKKGFTARSLASSEILATEELVLGSGKAGAELASVGSVFIGSRTKTAEILGRNLKLGSVVPAESEREKSGFSSRESKAVKQELTAGTPSAANVPQQHTETISAFAEKTIDASAETINISAQKRVELEFGGGGKENTRASIIIGTEEPKGKPKGKSDTKEPKPSIQIAIQEQGSILIQNADFELNVKPDCIILRRKEGDGGFITLTKDNTTPNNTGTMVSMNAHRIKSTSKEDAKLESDYIEINGRKSVKVIANDKILLG